MFYAYILYSQKLNKYYIGSTNNLNRRIEEHNRGKTAFSKQGHPWVLKYFEAFKTRQDAVKRELEIKNKKSRKYIEVIIGSEHPGM